jgi:hypothetical protein
MSFSLDISTSVVNKGSCYVDTVPHVLAHFGRADLLKVLVAMYPNDHILQVRASLVPCFIESLKLTETSVRKRKFQPFFFPFSFLTPTVGGNCQAFASSKLQARNSLGKAEAASN